MPVREAATGQVVEAGHGQGPAQPALVEVGVDRDDVDLPHGGDGAGVDLGPARAGQAAGLLVKEEAGGVEPGLGLALSQGGQVPAALLGVAGEGPVVDGQPRLLVGAGLERRAPRAARPTGPPRPGAGGPAAGAGRARARSPRAAGPGVVGGAGPRRPVAQAPRRPAGPPRRRPRPAAARPGQRPSAGVPGARRSRPPMSRAPRRAGRSPTSERARTALAGARRTWSRPPRCSSRHLCSARAWWPVGRPSPPRAGRRPRRSRPAAGGWPAPGCRPRPQAIGPAPRPRSPCGAGGRLGAWPVRGAPEGGPKVVGARLADEYPGSGHRAVRPAITADPFQLLVATILSAQCTDERVNMVTPAVVRRLSRRRPTGRGRPGRPRGADPSHRVLPLEGQEPDRHGPGRGGAVRRRGPRGPRRPGHPARRGPQDRPTWCAASPSGSPGSRSTPTSAGSSRRLGLTTEDRSGAGGARPERAGTGVRARGLQPAPHPPRTSRLHGPVAPLRRRASCPTSARRSAVPVGAPARR